MRLLIVDDNPLDIEIVSRMLQKRLGAVVESVHTAEEGLRRLRVEFYDVVLLDYSLPGKNGVDFLLELKAHKIQTPVLLVTARGDNRIQEEALQAGASDYISKDETLTPALYRAVEACVEKGRAGRALAEASRAEELRHTAERKISALEHRLEDLEGAIGMVSPQRRTPYIDTQTEDEKGEILRDMTRRYESILRLWSGSQQDSVHAREQLSLMVAEMFRFGLGGEHLLTLHTGACHSLRDQKWEPPGVGGCSPRMLLMEATMSLLDAYRRGLFSSPVA